MKLNKYELDTLELGWSTARENWFVRMVESKEQAESIYKMLSEKLIDVRSVSWAETNRSIAAYMIRVTQIGDEAMQAAWVKKRIAAWQK